MNEIMSGRFGLLLDPGSFSLIQGDEEGDLIGAAGTIDGRPVCVIAFNPKASTLIDPFLILQQELAMLDYAEEQGIPVIHLADPPSRVAMKTPNIPVNILTSFIDPRGAGRVFARFARLSGIVPRIAVVFRPIATTLTYPVAECDTVVMIEGSGMSLAYPDMVKLMTGDDSQYGEYGGARMHAEIAGTCDVLVGSEAEAISWVRRYLGYFPGNYRQPAPVLGPRDPAQDSATLDELIPEDPDRPFEIHALIEAVIDDGSMLEHRAEFGREAVTAFARIQGMPVGIIASNPVSRGGILFPETCRKIAAFGSLCDAFNIPLVFLADLPGFMIGKTAEQGGIIHAGALVFTTIANLSVPHLCVVIRKAYTAGLYAMGGPGFDANRFIALPGANIAIYGKKAVRMLALQFGLSREEQRSIEAQANEIWDINGYLREGYLDAIIQGSELREAIENFLREYYTGPVERIGPKTILCL
jgi:acetyl-CoA carboxylase carboxyltransferase component